MLNFSEPSYFKPVPNSYCTNTQDYPPFFNINKAKIYCDNWKDCGGFMIAVLPIWGKAIMACGHPVIAKETKEMESTLYIKQGNFFIYIYIRDKILMLNVMLVQFINKHAVQTLVKKSQLM